MKSRNRKGFAQLVPLILSIGVAIVILGVMASLTVQTRDTMLGDATGITNEALKDLTNASATSLVNEDITGTISVAMNDTAGVGDYTTVEAGNYTITTDGGYITLTKGGSAAYEGNDSIINYSYFPHPEAYNISDAGLTSLVTLSGYWGIIVTIGVFIIILGALMVMFKGGARR